MTFKNSSPSRDITKVAKVVKADHRGSKPGERRGGRQKGTPNKISLSVKQAILDTFTALGGVEHMRAWAEEHPPDFYKIAARLIPTEITGMDGGPVETSLTVEFVPVK